MRVKERQYDDHLHVWMIVCPLCGVVLASNSKKDNLPEYMICACDTNWNKKPAYELFPRNGECWIRRNKFPRFIGRVATGVISDIEDVEVLDEDVTDAKLAAAMRKAGEFLRKRRYGRKATNR